MRVRVEEIRQRIRTSNFLFVGQGYACWEKETRRKILYPYIYRGEGINRMKKAVISSGRDE